ncbi:HNH endonuclease [Paracoccus acridae]|uniref:HNH endonuclease n=1 Tax=Paracoccus acridae TaxID=1795310 RepID=UPI00166B0025|nr:HNH endonuclease signature motif containing protein [Paracoccus acridae]
MWKVRLPDVGDINDQLDTALTLKNGDKVYDLSAAERAGIHSLYAEYDQRLGEPDTALLPLALAGCADALHGAYNQVQKGQRLASLRSRLLSAVMECPLCGSGDATTLDHHLPKDDYRALAINPRNLVPSCQPCNRAKGTLAALAGQGMIHAYFQEIPSVTFLKANVTYADGSLKVAFSIDPAGLSPALADRLTFQLERIRLTERHPGAINIFIFSQKVALRLFRDKPGERNLLRQFLLDGADTLDEDFGLNHWRAALFRGLAACDAFLDDPWTYLDKPPPAMNPA